MQVPQIPFKILALAPFCGLDTMVWPQAALPVHRLELDQALATLKPTCRVPISREVVSDGVLDIDIRRLKDFHPDPLIQQIPVLHDLSQAQAYLKDALRRKLPLNDINTQLAHWPNLPPLDLEPLMPETTAASSESALDNILDMVALPGDTPSSPSVSRSPVQQLEVAIQQGVRAIFGNAEFRAMEAAWRGLQRLLSVSDNGAIKIEIVPVGFGTLEETLSRLLPDLIETPPALILIDLPFDSRPHRLGLLDTVAGVAETIMVPILCWITAGFFQLDTWAALTKLPFLPHYIEDAAFAKWRGLQNSPKGHWLAVTCNRLLSRYPYGRDNRPRRIRFEEEQTPWLNPVWGVGQLIVRSVAASGWATQFTNPQRHILEDLPLATTQAGKPSATELQVDRDRADQLARCGIMPVVDRPGRDWAMAPHGVTVSGLSLPYQLLVSRVTHLLLWCRDQLPRDLTSEDLAVHLRQAFNRFWEISGHPRPTDLSIEVYKQAPDAGLLVSIRLMPSRDILSTTQPVELTLNW